jgi:hypothetical protein
VIHSSVRKGSLTIATLSVLGLLGVACSSPQTDSGTSPDHPQSVKVACSLISSREAAELLGGSVVKPVANGKSACSYPGRAGSIIILQVREANLPRCMVGQNCALPAGAQKVKVSGVKALWVPATALSPGDTTEPGASEAGSLQVLRDGYYVNISPERVVDPLATAQQAMALVLPRL